MTIKIDPRAQLRMDILDDEMKNIRDPRAAARLLIIVAEGVHEGLFHLNYCSITDEGISIILQIVGTPLRVDFESSFIVAKNL